MISIWLYEKTEIYALIIYKICQLIDEYQKNFGESWRTVQADNAQPWPYLNEALTKFQVIIQFLSDRKYIFKIIVLRFSSIVLASTLNFIKSCTAWRFELIFLFVPFDVFRTLPRLTSCWKFKENWMKQKLYL